MAASSGPKSTPAERMQHVQVLRRRPSALVAVLLGTLVENFEINFMVGQAFAIAAASYFLALHERVVARHDHPRRGHQACSPADCCAVAAISLASWTTFITTQAAKFKSLGVVEPALVRRAEALLR
jgi:hypothetical protein